MTQSHSVYKSAIPIKIFAAILLFASIANISADMYVPSLPAIVKTFGTTTTAVQLTLFAFMFGYSSGHLFFGPISDRIGRRKPILAGIAFSMIGTVICIAAPTIHVLIAGRLIQGLGLSVCNSVGRAFIRDLISGPHLAKIGSYLGMIMVFFTASAPTLGGYFQHYYNWRAIFIFLFLYSLAILLFTWNVLPETNLFLNPQATKLRTVLKNYFIVLTNKTFLGYTFCVSLAYAGIISYVTCAPFILQNVVGLTPVQFGWLAFIIGGSIFISFYINSQFVMKLGIEKMVFVGICLLIIGGLLMLIFALLGYINTFVIMFPVAIFCMGTGLNFGNGSAGAFHPLPKMAGSVSALFGFLQILGGAAASVVMSFLYAKNQFPLAMVFITIGLLSLLSWKFLATNETMT